MTALFASVCMMYKPIKLPLPKMLWKMPACDTVTKLQVEKFEEMDAESVPATTISMGMFLTTYLRVERHRRDSRRHATSTEKRTGPGSPG